MHDLIFHHYQSSPYSEKIRLIFGYKQLAWKSVIIPSIMPKPNLTALTGGYRRTPVLQIGADIYCDTALIADVLERLTPTPTLYPDGTAGAARMLAHWADSTLFWTIVPYVFQPVNIPYLFGDITSEQWKAFNADRREMRGNMQRIPLGDATGALMQYLGWLEDMLADEKPYLLGAQVTIADFAVYHGCWLISLAQPVADMLEKMPRLMSWFVRMGTFGHGRSEGMQASQALEVARMSSPADPGTPAFVDTHGVAPGELVGIMPLDYGRDPVVGKLVLASDTELAVRHHDPSAGDVVVHFPRVGYQLTKV